MRSAADVSALGGPKTARREVWRPLSAPTKALGGQASPQALAGHVCLSCASAIDHVGSIGPTALERSLAAHLRSVGRCDAAGKVAPGDATGIVGWGAAAHSARRRGVTFAANASPVGARAAGAVTPGQESGSVVRSEQGLG